MRTKRRCVVEPLETRRLLTAYYVDPSGADSNDGLLPQSPWQSLTKVDSVAFQGGDSINLLGGAVFSGTLRLGADDAGSAAAPISVTSYGTGQATLAAGNAAGILVSDTSGINISDLILTGSGQSPNGFSGIQFDNNLPGNIQLPHAYIDQVDVSGFGKYGITIGGSNAKSGFSDVRITNANVYNNTVGGIETHGVFSSSATTYANAGVYVGYCTVHDNPGYAGSSNHVGDGIVLSDVNGGTIERCEAFNNGTLNTHNGGPVGIWAWDANGLNIQFNESYYNHTAGSADGGGFDLDGGCTHCTLQYNYSHGNDGAGFALFQFSGARPFGGNTVRYNVSENDARKNGYGAVDLWNGGSGVSNCDIYNNTIYLSPASSGASRAIYIQTGTTNVHVRDNIFQTAGGVTLADVEGKQSGLLFQGNDYWSGGSAFAIKYFAKSYSSLASWRKATSQETLNGSAVGLNANPLLNAPGNGGTVGNAGNLGSLTAYQLQSGSPMINAAINLWSTFNVDPGRQDFFGNTLPADKATAASYLYDLGADECA